MTAINASNVLQAGSDFFGTGGHRPTSGSRGNPGFIEFGAALQGNPFIPAHIGFAPLPALGMIAGLRGGG